MARQGTPAAPSPAASWPSGWPAAASPRPSPASRPTTPAAELQRRFVAHFGALTCRELTGCDITTPEGYAAYAAAGGNQRCGDYLEMAARTVVELIGE